MADEELNAIRERLAGNPLSLTPRWHRDCVTLLAEIDFLRALLHDLKQDSTAYQRGLENGIKAERQLRRDMMEQHAQEIRDLQASSVVYGPARAGQPGLDRGPVLTTIGVDCGVSTPLPLGI